MNPTLITVAVITYGLLAFASVLSKVVLFKNPQHATFKKVWIIVKSWWMIVSFIMVCLALAPWGLIAGFAFLSILGAREYFRFSQLEGYQNHLRWIVWAFIVTQYLALGFGQFGLFQVLPMIFILANLPLFMVLTAQIKNFPQVFSSIAGPILFFHFLAYLPGLYLLGTLSWKNESQALLAVFLVIFLTEANDILQFINGKVWGRRKIVPLISPNKTEAGFIGGMIGTTTMGCFAFHYFLEVSYWEGAILGVLISYFGILGDLFFSAVKRYFETKDFSEALPGHGGYLDRLDSLFLTVPIAFHALWYMKGGF